MRYFFGLDLGQMSDYSALAILETAVPGPEGLYQCRHLQRWPLRTPYPEIVADVAALVRRPEIQESPEAPVFSVDATGVGAPVVNLFRQTLDGPPSARLECIQITGGDTVTRDGDLVRVPKRDLVGAAQVALQTGRLKVASALEHAATLARELQEFKAKISLETAPDTGGAWREGMHDDLVLAVALGLWSGTQIQVVPAVPAANLHRRSPFNVGWPLTAL